MAPFESGKNAKELGIDLSRKFVALQDTYRIRKGDILRLARDDDSRLPFFSIVNRDELETACYWDRLACAPEEPSKEQFAVHCKTQEEYDTLMRAFEKFRDLTLSIEDKWLRENGLEDPTGVPTDLGIRLMCEMLYKENRDKLVAFAKEQTEEKG